MIGLQKYKIGNGFTTCELRGGKYGYGITMIWRCEDLVLHLSNHPHSLSYFLYFFLIFSRIPRSFPRSWRGWAAGACISCRSPACRRDWRPPRTGPWWAWASASRASRRSTGGRWWWREGAALCCGQDTSTTNLLWNKRDLYLWREQKQNSANQLE